MFVIKVFIITTLSFLIAMLWVPFLAKFLRKHNLGKQIRDAAQTPIYSELHKAKLGTPTMGGVLVWVTVAFLAFLFYFLDRFAGWEWAKFLNFLTRPQTFLPLGALIASALVGLADDYLNIKKIGGNGGGLRVRHRLLIYTFIAIVGALWFYFKLDWDVFRVPFLGDFNVGIWYIPIFIFIIVATAFSVNETDGLDGLAGGTLMTAFGAYGAIAFAQGKIELAAFCGAIIGALLAFLWFNIYPAKFFMGDTGAMSLGVVLGIIAMLTNTALFLPVICGVFVLESVSVIIQTVSKKIWGRKVFLSAPIHHHLEAKGWLESNIVMRFWVISGVLAVIGVILVLVDRSM